MSRHKHSFLTPPKQQNSPMEHLKNPNDPNFKPLYLSNDYDQVNRGIRKFLRRYNWYDPELNDTDKSWKFEVPMLPKRPKFKEKSKKNRVLEPLPLYCVFCSKFTQGSSNKEI